MKNPVFGVAFLALALISLEQRAAAQDVPVLPKSEGQNNSTASSNTPSSGLPGTSTGTPGTSSPATPTQPEGLNQSGNDIMGQDLLTGDWGGFSKTLQDDGVKLSPTYIGEVFGNPSGGMRQGVIYDGLLNVALDLDLDKMNDGGWLADTTIHTNALWIHGPGLSFYDVGDFSNTSNIAAYNTVRLQELWLQKKFWEDRVSLKIGNMAVDNEFFQSSSASLFINGTFGAFTFIANNVPNAPVYPLAAPGLRIQFLPTSRFYVMAGVYGQDVNSDPTTNNQNGTRFALTGSSGMLLMSEAGYLLNQSPNDRGLQGSYRLGSFVHTDDATTFNGRNGGTGYGIYGVMDQQLYSKADQTISLFVRSGGAPSNTNFVDYYIEGGFNFAGFVPRRDNDVAGIAVARSHVSDDFSDASELSGGPAYTAETVIEATYKAQIAPWWSVQPDAQYLVTPGGFEGAHNAVVLGVRTTVAF
jgi:porin